MSQRLGRLTQYFNNVATRAQRERLSDVLTGRASQLSSAESLVEEDLAQLSRSDLGCWVTAAAAQQFRANSAAWRAEEHLLCVDDLGAASNSSRWMHALNNQIGFCTMAHNAYVSVTAFVLPPHLQLDMHDHPSMAVWQAVLAGEVDALGLDWSSPGTSTTCRVVHAGALRTGSRHVIHPQRGGGVLHRIANRTSSPALFVDVITPPYYTAPTHLPCTYYRLVGPQKDDASIVVGDIVNVETIENYEGADMGAFVQVAS